jgi:GMC oxidoreductase
MPDAKPEIAAIAAKVNAGMFEAFSNTLVMAILTAMTYPDSLQFYSCLEKSSNPAVQAFLAATGGFGGMASELREPLFSFFFNGTCGPESTLFAMVLREAYLSGIWDLPLAVPLTGILPPSVFMANPDFYSKAHAPTFPPSRLYYDSKSNSIKHKDGLIDYIVVGSGPGGATVAHQLWEARKRVVLIEKGPWVVWGSMDTRSYPSLMFEQDRAATTDNGIILRSGEVMGGGSTVNIDLAFSPLEATIQARVDVWKEQELIDARFYTQENIAAAYQWVREKIETRQLSQHELNQDNKVLWDGAEHLGVDPKLYHLNRYRVGYSPSPVDDKRDAAEQLITPGATDPANPLSVISDAEVDEVIFELVDGQNIRATGVVLTMREPWGAYGNTIVDPCKLQIPVGANVTCLAENVILAGGTIGTTKVLLNTAKNNPAINNARIGRGLILHPSMPLVGVFDRQINLLEGLDSATFVDAFGVMPGFIFETMGGCLPMAPC